MCRYSPQRPPIAETRRLQPFTHHQQTVAARSDFLKSCAWLLSQRQAGFSSAFNTSHPLAISSATILAPHYYSSVIHVQSSPQPHRQFCFIIRSKMSTPTFVHLDMTNPPTGFRAASGQLDYFGWFRKQLEELRADSDLAVLTILVPAKHTVDSGEVDLSSWPQLHREYAAAPQDSPSSAVKMIPTFLRVVANSIDEVRGHTGHGQHANTQAPPQQAQNWSDVKTESGVGEPAHMSFDRAPAGHGHNTRVPETPANPAVPSPNVAPAGPVPPAPLDTNSFGRVAPPYPILPPNSATHHSQWYTPVPNPGDSKQQAGTPVSSATSRDPHSIGHPSPMGTPRHANSSFHNPSANLPGYPPAPRSGQLPRGQAPLPETTRHTTSHNPQAVSSAPGFGVTGSVGTPNPFSPVIPFRGSAWTPASSTASLQRSQSSASSQSQPFHAASVGSQGFGHSTRRSTRIQGRRLMGARGLTTGIQNMTGPTGGTDNSNSTDNSDSTGNSNSTDNNDMMDCGGSTHHG